MVERKVRYGVVCNGEHLHLFDTRAEAEADLLKEYELDAWLLLRGWITRRSRYWIEEVTGKAW